MTTKTSPIQKTAAIVKVLLLRPHTFAELHEAVGGDDSSIRNITRELEAVGLIRRHKPGPFKTSLFWWCGATSATATPA